MQNILLIKTSSLGDVVHNLPVANDILARFPRARIDWVVEEAYCDIVGMHPGVGCVIPVALRRWRGNVFSPSNWGEFRQFRRALTATRYDCIIDTQGLIKSAFLGWIADGTRHGYAASCAREPLAARFYDEHHIVPADLHAVIRNRRLVASALGYELPAGINYGIAAPGGVPPSSTTPYCVLLHSTSRADKLWPEEFWRSLEVELGRRGFASVLPWGSAAEHRRSKRIASDCASASVPASLTLPQIAATLAGARAVVGVDTGLTHLAAALEKPVVALYCSTRPGLTGVYSGREPQVRNLGAPGAIPRVAEVLTALREVAGGEFA